MQLTLSKQYKSQGDTLLVNNKHILGINNNIKIRS